MLDRGTARVVLVLFAVGTLVQLLAAVLAGLRQDWMRMSFMLFGSGLAVFFCTSALLTLKIDTCFSRLKDLIPEKSDSVRAITSRPINRKAGRTVNHVTRELVGIFMVISVPVHVSLAILAGLRQDSFRLGVHLAACAITVVICMGVLMALKIDACTRRLEELISRRNEGKASKELSGG